MRNKKLSTLIESLQVSTATGATLRVDRDAGIIYGVRVLGRFSKNTHNADGATKGTEYPPETQRAALELIEGQTVRTDHPERSNPDKARSVFDTFGVLRNPRIENRDGQDGTVADLHYLKEHPLASRVLEDVERQLGRFGLSINAYSGKESVKNGFLVIEEIAEVVGVDLVDRPATTRNLFESQQPKKPGKTMKTITLRQVFENLKKIPPRKGGFTPNRAKWANRLLEADDTMPVDIAAEMPAAAGDEGDDPDAMMAAAFRASCIAVLDSDADLKTKLNKIKDILTTEEKLLAKEEPEAPEETVQEADEDAKKDDEKKTEEEESKQESKAAKAKSGKSVLEDADAVELARLRREKKVRALCESKGVNPTGAQFKALAAMEDADRTEFLTELAEAGKAAGTNAPRSIGGWTSVIEGQGGNKAKPATVADEIALLRN